MKLAKRNSHPRDIRIRFDPDPHVYYIDGQAYDLSVTGFVKTFFHEFNAEEVINNNQIKWQKDKNSKYHGMSMQQIKDLWSRNAQESSIAGNKLHNDIEFFYNDIVINNSSLEFKFFLDFNNKIKGRYTPYRTEWTVFDEKIRLAGSIDMCYLNNQDEFLLFDWKRSRKIDKENNFRCGKPPLLHIPDSNYWHYCLQLNLYKYILENNYAKKVSGMCIVRLHPSANSYEFFVVPDLSKEIMLMLSSKNS